MYQVEPDPYCYPDSSVLKNKADLTSEAELDEFETAMTFAHSEEPPAVACPSIIAELSIIISFRICIPGPESSAPFG